MKVLIILVMLGFMGCAFEFDSNHYNHAYELRKAVIQDENIIYTCEDFTIYQYIKDEHVRYYDQDMKIVDKYTIHILLES